jgi:hypothetical protein
MAKHMMKRLSHSAVNCRSQWRGSWGCRRGNVVVERVLKRQRCSARGDVRFSSRRRGSSSAVVVPPQMSQSAVIRIPAVRSGALTQCDRGVESPPVEGRVVAKFIGRDPPHAAVSVQQRHCSVLLGVVGSWRCSRKLTRSGTQRRHANIVRRRGIRNGSGVFGAAAANQRGRTILERKALFFNKKKKGLFFVLQMLRSRVAWPVSPLFPDF